MRWKEKIEDGERIYKERRETESTLIVLRHVYYDALLTSQSSKGVVKTAVDFGTRACMEETNALDSSPTAPPPSSKTDALAVNSWQQVTEQ